MTSTDDVKFGAMQAAWRALEPNSTVSTDPAGWINLIQEMQRIQGQLVRAGEWVSGYQDLMHIGRVADGELTHSNIVAWLLEPGGRHRLGDALLRAIFRAGWGDLAVPSTESALVSREVRMGGRIADIVVYAGSTTLIVENKVWAQESPMQCEDLYRIWTESEHGTDVRFLLLTLDGHPPRETRSPEAAEAWRRLAYASLGGWLAENVAAPGGPTDGSGAVTQYVATIRETCRKLRNFEIMIGGGRFNG